jgi:methylated-DNA-[protein]-cysteine S-methyltransferase
MDLLRARFKSPIGSILLYVHDGALVALNFEDRCQDLERHLARRFGPVRSVDHKDPAGVVTRLRAYFNGDVQALDPVAVDPAGTPFQRLVWAELRKIPAGRTASYADIARRIGRSRAVRAVGTANGENPVSLVIPCHRVIGSDGKLHGYGGGLDRKEWLLAHEAQVKTALV